MNERIKQRIIGAVVLLCLAVIFIPMLLDGGGRDNSTALESNIPPRPGYQFNKLEFELELPPRDSRPERHIISQAEPGEQPVAEADNIIEPEGRVDSPPEPPPQQPPHSEAAPTADRTADSQAWVVQVGSFSNSANAIALRDRLRGKGFTAFVEKLDAQGGRSYRVRLGPEVRREQAEQLMSRVKAELSLPGIVMSYP